MSNINDDLWQALGVANYTPSLAASMLGTKTGTDTFLLSPSMTEDASDYFKSIEYGKSRYDRGDLSPYEMENLEDVRANSQPAALKILNGLGKMVSTAVTTIGSSAGMIYGLTGLNHLLESDKKGYGEGIWNNAVIEAMQSAQDKMEEILPNYYSNQERSNAWYQNIFTANFWGDKYLKNLGFTIGAMATMPLGLGKVGLGAGKLVSTIAKVGAKTQKGLRAANTAGKFATQFTNGLLASAGEGSIEAFNGAKSYRDNALATAKTNYEQQKETINNQFDEDVENGMDYSTALALANRRNEQLEKEYDDIQQQIKQRVTSVGNNIFLLNLGILTISNNLQFARLLQGGWKTSKNLLQREGVRFLIDGKETTNLKAWGKALAKGTADIEGVDANVARGILGGTVKNMLSEGSEELFQNLASGSQQIQKSAQLNAYVKKRNYENPDKFSLYGHSINPEVTDECVNFLSALGKTWKDEFGKASAGGWEEFVLGALTGGFGTISLRTKKNGKTGIGWQGGFYEAYQDIQAQNAENELRTQIIKNYINKPEFKENTKHAIATMSLSEEMDRALYNDDVATFKNAEMASLVNDALFFKNKGMLDAYVGYYEEMAKGLTDTDVENIKELTRQQLPNVRTAFASYFEGKTTEDIKNTYRDKAISNLDKINKTIETAEELTTKYYDKIYEAAEGNEERTKQILNNLIVATMLRDDMVRRKNKLERENAFKWEIDELDEKIQEADKRIEELINNPKKEIELLNKIDEIAAKKKAGKDSELVIDRYRNAQSIQEVADIFYYTEPEQRSAFFKKAYDSAEGENKELLGKFKTFAIQAGSVFNIATDIINKNQNEDIDFYSKVIPIFAEYMDNILHDIANDENSVYTFDSLAENIRNDAQKIGDVEIDEETQTLREVDGEQTKFSRFLNEVADELDKIETFQQMQDSGEVATEVPVGDLFSGDISSNTQSQSQPQQQSEQQPQQNDNATNDETSSFTPPESSIKGNPLQYDKRGNRIISLGVSYIQNKLNIDLDLINNIILPKIFRKNKNQIPVSFVKLRDNDDYIYVAIKKEYGEGFENFLKEIDGYYIVGHYYNPHKSTNSSAGSKSQYDLINKDINEKGTVTKSLIVSNLTSHIYDFYTGSMSYDTNSFVSLGLLLNNPVLNPLGLRPSNMKWIIKYGSEETGKYDVTVNLENNDIVVGNTDDFEVGTVTLLIPNAKGELVPAIKISANNNYNDAHINRESKYWKFIEQNIKDVIFAKGAKSIEDAVTNRKIAISKLRDKLGLSRTTNNDNVHFGDDANKSDLYNHLIMDVNNQRILDINFNDPNLDLEQALQQFQNALSQMNPDININKTDLANSNTLQMLLDANILTTNAKQLYFSNVQPYIRPFDQNGKELDSFESVSSRSNLIKPSPTIFHAFVLDGRRVVTDGNGNWFYTISNEYGGYEIGNVIDYVQHYNDIFEIETDTTDKCTYLPNRNIYRASSGLLYERRENNTYSLVKDSTKYVKEKEKLEKEENERKEKEKLKEILDEKKTETTQTDKTTNTQKTIQTSSFGEPEIIDDTKKKKTKKNKQDKKIITSAQGSVLEIKDENTVDETKKISNFAETLTKENKEDELFEAVEDKLGKSVDSFNQLNDILKNSKQSGLYLNTLNNPSVDNINSLLNKIKECGL